MMQKVNFFGTNISANTNYMPVQGIYLSRSAILLSKKYSIENFILSMFVES